MKFLFLKSTLLIVSALFISSAVLAQSACISTARGNGLACSAQCNKAFDAAKGECLTTFGANVIGGNKYPSTSEGKACMNATRVSLNDCRKSCKTMFQGEVQVCRAKDDKCRQEFLFCRQQAGMNRQDCVSSKKRSYQQALTQCASQASCSGKSCQRNAIYRTCSRAARDVFRREQATCKSGSVIDASSGKSCGDKLTACRAAQ